MTILDILLFPAVLALIGVLLRYKERRKFLEISGLYESKLESCYKEFIVNYLFVLPILPIIMLLDFLIGLIL